MTQRKKIEDKNKGGKGTKRDNNDDTGVISK
jgi:hypothetical protein